MVTVLAVSASLIAVQSPSNTSDCGVAPGLGPSCQPGSHAALLLASHSVMGDYRDRQGGPEAERRGMTPAVILSVIIYRAAGLTLRWNGQKSVAAPHDVKAGHTRVKGRRRTR